MKRFAELDSVQNYYFERLSGHRGCAMLSERCDVRNRKASKRKMQLVMSVKPLAFGTSWQTDTLKD
ncbi:hypothetical protein DPX16_4094 [Anabarilius grahami]|uniref:Uncharacterized protein n=1 Tax=Anabarilius grahami TaxID=495550 RepID=A0A3N0XYQ6_ANAGA|nr:hypothetical protein DPX16_4094 [Anabarilius grahami]